MAEETIVMTQKAVGRLGWFSRLLTGSFEKKAAGQLGLGVRQIKRLVARDTGRKVPRDCARAVSVALCLDAAPVDDRRWTLEAQGAQVGPHPPAAPSPSVSWRTGADRRFIP